MISAPNGSSSRTGRPTPCSIVVVIVRPSRDRPVALCTVDHAEPPDQPCVHIVDTEVGGRGADPPSRARGEPPYSSAPDDIPSSPHQSSPHQSSPHQGE